MLMLVGTPKLQLTTLSDWLMVSADLFTKVIDWEEMRDIQLAFSSLGVPHIDTPQDHAFLRQCINLQLKTKLNTFSRKFVN